MKVAMLIWLFWPAREGGAERQCRLISRLLVEKGGDVSVVTSWPGWGVPRREIKEGVCILRCGLARPILNTAEKIRDMCVRRSATSHTPVAGMVSNDGRRRRLRFLAPFRWMDRLAFIVEAAGVLRRIRPDVIHVHESHWIAGVAVWVARMLRIPCVCKESTYPVLPRFEPDIPFSGLWDRKRRECDQYIALTEEGAQGLVAEGINPRRITIIPNGVELPNLARRQPEPNMVLCVGNLTQGAHQKGFDILVSAWPLAAKEHPNAKLIVAGGGDATPWRRMAEQLGCADSIEFPGYCVDPTGLYSRAAVFVLSSRKEGMSNALLEAQSWGIPCVVTDIPGNRAVVRHGENGIVVPVDDASALAEGLCKLLDSRSERETMGAAARKIVERDFSLSQVATRWMEVYKTLTNKRG